MYMDNIELFAKNKKEYKTLILTIGIYSQDIGMEFVIEKCAMLVICCDLERPEINNTKRCKVYSSISLRKYRQ